MCKISNYQSPACTTINVCVEGILCVSTGEVKTPSTENFDQVTDFEW